MATKKLKPKREHCYFKAFLLSLLTALIMILPKIILNGGVFYDYSCLLNWLPLPVSFAQYIPYLAGPILMLRFALGGLFSYCYMRRFVKNQNAAVIGSLAYTFSGFALCNMNFAYFDSIMLFPLLLLGLEALVTDKTRGLLAVATFICAIANPFVFVAMAIFLVIYFIIRALSADWQLNTSAFFSTLLEFVLGVVMAGALLLPMILNITANMKFINGWELLAYNNGQNYLSILFGGFLTPEFGLAPSNFPLSSEPSTWLTLISVTGVAGVFISFKKHWLKRILVLCLVFALVPVLNSTFSLFSANYSAHWYFMPVLMMSLCSAVAFDRHAEIEWRPAYRITFLLTVIPLMSIGLLPAYENGSWHIGLYDTTSPTSRLGFWVNVAIAVLCLVIMGILLRFAKTRGKLFLKMTLISMVLICMVLGAYDVICHTAPTVTVSPYDYLAQYQQELMLYLLIGAGALLLLILYVCLCKGYIHRGGGKDTATYGAAAVIPANNDEIPKDDDLSEFLSNIGDAPENSLFDK
ncbi:MAG: YfhO family protein [Clostridia bacterium]|nr:YfhO family protein [Clostridia bacterium]